MNWPAWVAAWVAWIVVANLADVLARRSPGFAVWWNGALMVAYTVAAALAAAARLWAWAALMAAGAALFGVRWWRSRNRRGPRRRALALLGDKSRRLLARLVARQREAAGEAR